MWWWKDMPVSCFFVFAPTFAGIFVRVLLLLLLLVVVVVL
jgi:hypothetical protein